MKGTQVRKIVFGTSLFIVLAAAGCTSAQLHQSLLMHENRQLEDALYTAHAQVADLQRENDLLRKQQTSESLAPPVRPRTDPGFDDWDFETPLEMPKVILPDGLGTTEVPEFMRGSQTIPPWTPRR